MIYLELCLQLVTLQFSSALLASIAPSPGQVSTWKEKKQVNPTLILIKEENGTHQANSCALW